jgi:hypothetical protein
MEVSPMRQVRTYVGVFLVLFLMAACGKGLSSEKERAFAALVPVPTDTGLRLRLIEVRDGSSAYPTITLSVENHSNDQVWFLAPGYGARMFVYSESDEGWIEVDDRVVSASESEDILVPKGHGMNWGAILSVGPSIPDTNKTVTVRVVVIGEIYRDGRRTGEAVGAYTDVTIRR